MVQSYMIFGGIPYYLGYIDGEYSLARNVDEIFFAENAKLANEYDRLFDSVFISPEIVKSIVQFLYTQCRIYQKGDNGKTRRFRRRADVGAFTNVIASEDLFSQS